MTEREITGLTAVVADSAFGLFIKDQSHDKVRRFPTIVDQVMRDDLGLDPEGFHQVVKERVMARWNGLGKKPRLNGAKPALVR